MPWSGASSRWAALIGRPLGGGRGRLQRFPPKLFLGVSHQGIFNFFQRQEDLGSIVIQDLFPQSGLEFDALAGGPGVEHVPEYTRTEEPRSAG